MAWDKTQALVAQPFVALSEARRAGGIESGQPLKARLAPELARQRRGGAARALRGGPSAPAPGVGGAGGAGGVDPAVGDVGGCGAGHPSPGGRRRLGDALSGLRRGAHRARRLPRGARGLRRLLRRLHPVRRDAVPDPRGHQMPRGRRAALRQAPARLHRVRAARVPGARWHLCRGRAPGLLGLRGACGTNEPVGVDEATGCASCERQSASGTRRCARWTARSAAPVISVGRTSPGGCCARRPGPPASWSRAAWRRATRWWPARAAAGRSARRTGGAARRTRRSTAGRISCRRRIGRPARLPGAPRSPPRASGRPVPGTLASADRVDGWCAARSWEAGTRSA